MSDFINLPILFLDYDGVLHPDEVFNSNGHPFLNVPGMRLFEYIPHLIEVLNDYPEVHIVLSTSWVGAIGFEQAKAYLPSILQDKIVGSTNINTPICSGWTVSSSSYTRYQQIQKWLNSKFVAGWVALDNDADGWPEDKRSFFVQTDNFNGISLDSSKKELSYKLDLLVEDWTVFNSDCTI